MAGTQCALALGKLNNAGSQLFLCGTLICILFLNAFLSQFEQDEQYGDCYGHYKSKPPVPDPCPQAEDDAGTEVPEEPSYKVGNCLSACHHLLCDDAAQKTGA